MREEWGIETLTRWIRARDPTVAEGSEDYEAAIMLLAALRFGHKDRGHLAAFTGVSPSRVHQFAKRLEFAGVWKDDGTTACTRLDEYSNYF